MSQKDDASLLMKKIAEFVEKFGEIEIDGAEIRAEELTLMLQPIVRSALPPPPRVVAPKEEFPSSLLTAEFSPPLESFPGRVEEIQIGATKAEGGTRSRVVTLGGAKTMPFYSFEATNLNRPVLAMDVFDMPISLAKPVKQNVEDVMSDPAEWAKKCVRDFGADVVSFNLVSTDPLINDTPVSEAAKTVERVLQAVDAPVIIGGSGNKEKDPYVLEAVAQVAHGEKIVLNSVSTDTDYKRVVKAAKEHGHTVVSFTPMDLNNQKRLNRLLLDEGLPKNQIIQDPTTAALGYGLEYAYSIMERIRLAALMGDEDLQMPILSAASNAWGAREAWMKTTEWGPREIRGPLWEAVTCLTLMMAGADLFMISHPATVRIAKRFLDAMYGVTKTEQKAEDWITALK